MGRSKINTALTPTPQETRPQGGDWRRILPGLAVSALTLGLVFYFADLQKLGDALRLADYRFVLLSMLVTLTWLLVRGVVWRTLLQDKATYSAVFWSLNEGYLLNNLLPFRLGEVGKSYLLARRAGLDFWQVVSTVIVERLLDLALAAGLLFGTLPFVVGATWARQAVVVVGIGVGLLFLALFLLARAREPSLRTFKRWSLRWPFLTKVGGKAVPAFFDGLSVLTNGWRFLQAVGWILLNWLVAIGQYWLMLHAFFPAAKFLWATFSLGVAALGIAAPSSPGAVGVLELSIVGALSLFSLDASVALALALVIHVVQYLITGVLGSIALARDGESLMDIYRLVKKLKVTG